MKVFMISDADPQYRPDMIKNRSQIEMLDLKILQEMVKRQRSGSMHTN